MISPTDLSDVFSDLTPIEQDDGIDPVCTIDYSSAFKLAYGYIRAVWGCGETSDRALQLTALCLQLNPANFTVWHFRRQCLRELGYSEDVSKVIADLGLAAKLGGSNPKNYQIWYHRRALIEMGSASMLQNFISRELEYTAGVLDIDCKNYHAWSHRQWIVRSADDEDIWENEVTFANNLIDKDPRNNSAWNQRWFACHRSKKVPLSAEVAQREIDFVIDNDGRFDPYNESQWRYLIAVVKEQKLADSIEVQSIASCERRVCNVRAVLEDAGRDPGACTNWISARIDLLAMVGDKKSLETATGLAKTMATTHDTIREKYWKMRVDQMQKVSHDI